MTQATPPIPETSPLDAAKTIVETLKGLDTEKQTLAIKFASETLGLPTLAAHPSRSVPSPSSLTDSQVVHDSTIHSTDIKQFTTEKAPKSDQQFAAVVAYFYQFEAPVAHRKQSIDAATMKQAARLAGHRQVKNWRVTLHNAKKAGYLDTEGKGAFKLSTVGENLVAMTLPDGGAEASPNAEKRKRKTSKKTPTKKPAAVRSASADKGKKVASKKATTKKPARRTA